MLFSVTVGFSTPIHSQLTQIWNRVTRKIFSTNPFYINLLEEIRGKRVGSPKRGAIWWPIWSSICVNTYSGVYTCACFPLARHRSSLETSQETVVSRNHKQYSAVSLYSCARATLRYVRVQQTHVR